MKRGSRGPMSTRARSAFQSLAGATTSLATFGALVATGWITGIVARDYEDEQARKAADRARAEQARADWFAAHPVTRVVEKRRKHRTEVRTVRVFASQSAVPGPGGSMSIQSGSGPAPGSAASSGGSGPSGGSSGAPKPATPPPPPPPPAPSSGS